MSYFVSFPLPLGVIGWLQLVIVAFLGRFIKPLCSFLCLLMTFGRSLVAVLPVRICPPGSSHM